MKARFILFLLGALFSLELHAQFGPENGVKASEPKFVLLQHANNENGGQCRQDEEDELNVETVVGIAVAQGGEVCHGWGRLGQHKSGQ